MAITYTRTTLGTATDLAATAAAGGLLTASTQFWFVVVPYSTRAVTSTTLAMGLPTNIATATTDATNRTINLTWSAVPNALGYSVYWTKVDPGTDPTNFNLTGYKINDNASYTYSSVATNSFSFSTEQTSGAPTHSMKYDDAYRFQAIYNDNVDYITILNSTDADRSTMEKLYQKCVAMGWDSVQKKHDCTYYVKANINHTSGSSVFESKNELITTIGCFYNNLGSSVTYFGTGTNDLDSENGTTWISLACQGASWNNQMALNTVRMYNFQLRVIRQGYKSPITTSARYFNVNVGGNYQIANCTFDCIQYLIPGAAVAGSFMKDVTILNSRWPIQFASDTTNATLENIKVVKSQMCSYVRFSPTIKGFYQKSVTGTYSAILINQTEDVQVTLIDSNFPWTNSGVFQWYNNGRMATGNEYAKNKYTVKITAVNKNNTPISGASVILLDKDGTERMNVNTDANGVATYEVEAGIHKSNATTAVNTGYYTSYSPFTLTIKKSGYKTYKSKFSLLQKTDEIITLEKVLTNNISGPVQSWQ